MKLSATQAAERVGKSVPTITRAIKSGKLSAKKRPDKGYDIDPAELFRVWPAVMNESDVTSQMSQGVSDNSNSVLEAEIAGLRERLADKDSTIEDLRKRLDREGEERRQLTAVLTDERTRSSERTASWWPFKRK